MVARHKFWAPVPARLIVTEDALVLVWGARDLLITADIAYDRAAFVGNVLSGSLSAPKAARDSLARVRRFATETPDAIVQFGHDPTTWHATSHDIHALSSVARMGSTHVA